jgi:anti-repressor protein
MNIQIIDRKGIEVVDSILLHKILDVKSHHKDWIRRRIDGYGFIEGEDYFNVCRSNLSTKKTRGGHNINAYLLTLDMAKELAMLENSEVGKQVRKYFILAEKELRKALKSRKHGILTRKTMTDLIEESGENERMHNRGFSNYTLLAYELTGLKDRYKEYKQSTKDNKFRDSLHPEELDRLETVEDMIKNLLKIGKVYSEVKESLIPLFTGLENA